MSDTFTGGPIELFDVAGREQLIALLEHGLVPTSVVADIGCGALRGGRWIIPLLEAGHYCGVEPNQAMVDRGLREFVDADIARLKSPRFSFNSDFDLSEFDVLFTHVLMRSIWTHCSKQQIEKSLDAVVRFGSPDVVLLTSVVKPSRNPFSAKSDYKGDSWVGRSHESDVPGVVAHSFPWLRKACRTRGLSMAHWRRRPVNDQIWLRITRS